LCYSDSFTLVSEDFESHPDSLLYQILSQSIGAPLISKPVLQAGQEQSPGLEFANLGDLQSVMLGGTAEWKVSKHLGLCFKFQSDSAACTTFKSWHMPNACFA
jgi:hypothetical protein